MVKKVDIYGKQAKKIYVEFSHQRLAALGITPAAIAESLRSQNSVLAAGSIDTQGDRVLVRVSGQFATEDDIRNVPITAGGRTIKLGDFTTITRGFEDPPDVHRAPQRPAGADARHRHDRRRQHRRPRQGRSRRKWPRSRPSLPHGVELERVADQPTTVSECDLGVRALAPGSARHRARRVPAEPRLAHRHRRRASRAARAGRRGRRDAGDGLEPRAHLARLADHRARPARRRRDHRRRDDGREDGGRLGPRQGGRLLVRSRPRCRA